MAGNSGWWRPRAGEDGPVTGSAMDAELESARAELFAARAARVRPLRDEKILTGWNALAIRGLVDVAQHLNRPDCLVAATQALDFLHARHWQGDRLLASSHAGQAGGPGYLDDYALLLDAVLALLAARWRESDFHFARALADALLARFTDSAHGGFFFTSDEHEALLERSKVFGDDACPSGNGAAARALRQLGLLTGEARYLDSAARTLHAGMTDAGRWPSAHATLMRALIEHLYVVPVVVLRAADDAVAHSWQARLRADSAARVTCYVVPGTVQLAATRAGVDGAAATALLCRDAAAGTMFTDSEALRAALA